MARIHYDVKFDRFTYQNQAELMLVGLPTRVMTKHSFAEIVTKLPITVMYTADADGNVTIDEMHNGCVIKSSRHKVPGIFSSMSRDRYPCWWDEAKAEIEAALKAKKGASA